MEPPAVSSPAGGKDRGPLDPINLQRPALEPTMLRLRPGDIAVLLSLTGVGLIVPAPVARASDPPRVRDAATLGGAEQQFFEKQVRPLLIKHCFPCHSSEAKVLKGGLRLDSRGGWMKGGDSGPAIVPGSPDESLLIDAIRYQSLEMPPEGKLPESEIRVLERWVRMGAPDPRTDPAPEKPAKTDPDAGRSHWAFRPIAEPPVPRVKDEAWPRSDVDRFILARLESEGLSPVPDADRPTLLRRRLLRPGRRPADPGRDRIVRRGRRPRRVREGRRCAPGPPRIRSTLGPSLARRRSLCRLQRFG